MKFECNRTDFTEALLNVSRAAAQKSTLSIIEGILIKATSDGLYLCCYNLDMGIAKTVPAHIQRTGAAVMPIRLLDMIRRLPGERVMIECSEKYVVHIESAMTEFDIIAMPADDFPELPIVVSENAVQIEESKLRTMISMTSHALSTRPDKPVYTGALFEVKEGYMRVTTLDGCRIAIRNEQVSCVEDFSFIVPGKSLNDVARMLSDSEDIAEINVGKNNAVFIVNGYSIVSRLMSGKFTDCSTLFNTSKCYEVRAKTADILAGVERMALVLSESHLSPVRCLFDKDIVKFTCETPVGRAESAIACSCPCERLVIGINNRFMLNAFKAVDTDEMRIMVSDRMRPIIVLPPEGDHFRFLMMPLDLNESPEEKKREAEQEAEENERRAPREVIEVDFGADASPEDEAYFGDDSYDD